MWSALRERVPQLTVGDPAQNHNLGPVINKAALKSMLRYIEIGKKEGRLIAGGHAPQTAEGGFYLEPTVFADVAPDAVLAQEEIFGPVLALIKVENFDEGLAVANNTEYGLTGAVYSNEPRTAGARAARIPRRQPLLQSQMHRGDGGRASVWRVQHERDGFEGGRPGLSVPVYAGQERGREAAARVAGRAAARAVIFNRRSETGSLHLES